MTTTNSNNKRRTSYYAILIATAIAVCIFAFYKPKENYIRISSVIWNTEYHITYQGTRDMTDSINTVLNAIDNSLSMFNSNSLVARINAGDSTANANGYMIDLINRSKKINRLSNGYYDITVAPLVNLWGFGTKGVANKLPSKQQIDSVLSFVGINKVTVSANGHVTKQNSNIVLDFSSIAKGFACDELGKMFLRNDIDNFIVEIGGEICAHGVNPGGNDWSVSVDQPIESNDSIIHKSAVVLRLANKGLATSGNYRNYREVEGTKVWHIINPLTGYPEHNDLLSATIIASNAADADGLATACMALGKKESIKMIESNNDIDALLIYVDSEGKMRTWQSSGFAKSVIK
ncbi:MAG: FAD:protein FMN transferase [Muribaculaceae bacterium]